MIGKRLGCRRGQHALYTNANHLRSSDKCSPRMPSFRIPLRATSVLHQPPNAIEAETKSLVRRFLGRTVHHSNMPRRKTPPMDTEAGVQDRLTRKRLLYFSCALAAVATGLASRRYRDRLPEFIAEYAGDALWALMVYLLVSTLLAGVSTWFRAGIALLFAFLVEISQLHNAPWIDTIRATTLGGLVLGHGFLWSDFACYTVGVTIGIVADRVIDWLVHAKRFTTDRHT